MQGWLQGSLQRPELALVVTDTAPVAGPSWKQKAGSCSAPRTNLYGWRHEGIQSRSGLASSPAMQ